MTRLIDDYSITGAAALEGALNQAVGTVATATQLAQEVKESSFGEQFWQVMSRVALTLKVAKSAHELGHALKHLLLRE